MTGLHSSCAGGRTRLRNRRSGFNLVELTIVAGLVALAVTIMLPVLVRAREQQRRVTCQASLRAVGVAVGTYAASQSMELPPRYQAGGLPFDVLAMWLSDGQAVNLGLLRGYVSDARAFYCAGQSEEDSPDLAFNGPANPWASGLSAGGGGGGGAGSGSGGSGGPHGPAPAPRCNASYAGRPLTMPPEDAARWRLYNYTNKVIYSDFLGVDDWPGEGRFRHRLRAPHGGNGYNRLFGDGSVQWVDAALLHAVRRIDERTPDAGELRLYYEAMDTLP